MPDDVRVTIGGDLTPFKKAMFDLRKEATETGKELGDKIGVEGLKGEGRVHSQLEGLFRDAQHAGSGLDIATMAVGRLAESFRLALPIMIAFTVALEVFKSFKEAIDAGTERIEKMRDTLEKVEKVDLAKASKDGLAELEKELKSREDEYANRGWLERILFGGNEGGLKKKVDDQLEEVQRQLQETESRHVQNTTQSQFGANPRVRADAQIRLLGEEYRKQREDVLASPGAYEIQHFDINKASPDQLAKILSYQKSPGRGIDVGNQNEVDKTAEELGFMEKRLRPETEERLKNLEAQYIAKVQDVQTKAAPVTHGPEQLPGAEGWREWLGGALSFGSRLVKGQNKESENNVGLDKQANDEREKRLESEKTATEQLADIRAKIEDRELSLALMTDPAQRAKAELELEQLKTQELQKQNEARSESLTLHEAALSLMKPQERLEALRADLAESMARIEHLSGKEREDELLREVQLTKELQDAQREAERYHGPTLGALDLYARRNAGGKFGFGHSIFDNSLVASQGMLAEGHYGPGTSILPSHAAAVARGSSPSDAAKQQRETLITTLQGIRDDIKSTLKAI